MRYALKEDLAFLRTACHSASAMLQSSAQHERHLGENQV